MRRVDVGVLVGDAVARVAEDHLDAGGQLVRTLHAGIEGRHALAVFHRVSVQEDRDLHLHRVVPSRERVHGEARLAFAQAVAHAGLTDLAEQLRQHHDGAGGHLAVGAALAAVALRDVARLRLRHLAGQVDNALLGNLRDGRSPRRRLRRAVRAIAQDVVLVGSVLALRGLRQRLFVVADTVGVQELLVGPAVVDDLVGQRRGQSRIGAGTDRDPLATFAAHGVAHARIDADHTHVFLFAHVRKQVRAARAAHARVGGAVAEEHHQLVVLQREQRAATAAAVGVGVGHGVLGGTVAAVVAQIAAHQVEQAKHNVLAERADAGHHARALRHVYGLVAVGFLDAVELAHNGVERLVPGNLFELALAALADKLHGVIQAIGAAEPTANGAARAGRRASAAGRARSSQCCLIPRTRSHCP